MKLNRWLKNSAFAEKNLSYKLNVIFGLFFLVPVFGLLYFAVKYEILSDEALPYFFIILLVFSLLGFTLLRGIFDRIIGISREVKKHVSSGDRAAEGSGKSDELENIANSFAAMEHRADSAFSRLERKVSEVSLLKELSDLCYVTLDSEELLHITLERALKLADADIGSVMIFEGRDRDHFVVRATIGLGDRISIGDRVDFAASIARYAVINKSPLVIEDIETDTRFGRINRPQYGTRSFICMPIKTIRDIIGVITLSRRTGDVPFTTEQADVIAPLISNAAFTFENLRLMREGEGNARLFRVLDRISEILGSGIGGRELVKSVLGEVRHETAFRRAVILLCDESRTGDLSLYDCYDSHDVEKQAPKPGTRYSAGNVLFERLLRRGHSIVTDDAELSSTSPEGDLLGVGNGENESSMLLVPMKNDGNITGMLAMCGIRSETAATVRGFIEHVAAVLGLVIVRDTLSAAVTRRADELATLRQIGGALASSTFDINQVLSYTMDMIKGTMHVEAGSLFLVEDNELECSIAFGLDMRDMRERRLKQGEGIAGYVAARGETVVVNDFAASTLFQGYMYEMNHFRADSVLAVPLVSQGRVIGVLEVLNKTIGDFNNDDAQLLQSIASSVSIALENARLYSETLSMAEQEREIRRIFQKFVPKEIVDKIIHGADAETKLHDEFRTLTLLNIDIRGFSGMARRVGPQKTVSLLNHFFSIMGEIVFRHDGIVDKYLGDGFLALFGAPVSSPADADNAIRAALEMREALLLLNERFIEEAQTALNVGISIHTGEVVVGNIGFEKKMDYTVIGDSVNAVFRIQNLTKNYANGILISEKTLRATQSRFELREVGRSDIDAAQGEIAIYEVLSSSGVGRDDNSDAAMNAGSAGTA